MAMTYQNFASLGVNLNRQKYGPLDISNVFTSAADLKYYLTKGTFTEGVSEYWYKNANEKIVPYPYEGQVLATVIDGVVSVYALSLDAEGNFKTQEIGAKVEVDGKTIKLNADGKLELVGLPADIAGKTLVPSLVNGVLTWAEPDTSTAEGQAQEIEGLKTRATALEAAVNGSGEGESRVPGLVDKVAALEAVDNATQAELDAYKTEVTTAIGEALQAAKDYADANDADTVYDDTALAARVKALEDEERYDETALANRVTANEEAIIDLGEAIDGVSDAVADEKTRAEAAEKALGERIDAIDFIDADELATELAPYAKTADVETALTAKADKTALEALQSTVDAFLTGDGTEAALDSLKELIAYIDEHDGADLTEMIATIEGIEGKLAGIDSTVVAYVTAAIDALKIGDYAKAADLTALAGRVEALEAKPFDTYATKTEVSNVDAKFANYTTTETLTTQLAAKADADKVVANDTFETFKTENTTAIGTAKSEAIAAAAKAVEDAGYAVASDVAETYATKTALTEAVEGIENDLLAYAKTADVEAELAKKINKATISHSTDEKAEGATVTGTQLDIVVDAFTKAETRQYVADTIKTMTGGESAADVKLLLENHVAAYTEKVGQIDAKDAAQDTAIATAQAQADKGVADAAEVAVGLVTANANIGNNTREIETVKGTITTVNETLSGKITALENKDVEIAGLVSGLDTAVKGNATTIGEHTAAITALQAKDTELAGLINGVDAKFANYYDKDVVDAKVIASGEVVRGTADAIAITGTKITVTVNSYTKDEVDSLLTNFNRTELANGIEANTTALAVLVGTVEGDDKKSVRNIAKEEVAAIVGAAPEALDTLEEIATWIGTDTTGAAAMASDITSLKAKVDTGDKTVSEYVDDAIAAIPDLVVATAETLGGVKSSTAENKVTVSTDGTMEVNSVNANKLVQTEGDILVLDGGRALN